MARIEDRAPAADRGRRSFRRSRASLKVDVAGQSHIGRRRARNEDHFYILRFGRFLKSLQTNIPANEAPPSVEEGGVGMVVADGLGERASGARASHVAILALHQLAMETPDWLFRLDDDRVREVMRRARERIAAVDAALDDMASSNPELGEFGTTMTVAFHLARDLFVASIGNSRAYIMRAGRLRPITRDHTLAEKLADEGFMPPDVAKTHYYRRVLTRAVGLHGGLADSDVQGMTLEDGDRLLLCTDGLTDKVGDREIGMILREATSPRRACRYLVNAALAAGGEDNVTAVVAFYRRLDDPYAPADASGLRK